MGAFRLASMQNTVIIRTLQAQCPRSPVGPSARFFSSAVNYELGFIGKSFGESQEILRRRAFPFVLTELGGNVALVRRNNLPPIARIDLHRGLFIH